MLRKLISLHRYTIYIIHTKICLVIHNITILETVPCCRGGLEVLSATQHRVYPVRHETSVDL